MNDDRDELTTDIYPHLLDPRFKQAMLWGVSEIPYVLGTSLDSEEDGGGSVRVLSAPAMFARAQQFASAGDALEPRYQFVTYFLYARSIELALKAFLCASGWAEHQLRQHVGHDLSACLHASEAAGLARYVSLTEQQRAAIHWIDRPYRQKEFEYTRVVQGGARMLEMPSVGSVAVTAAAIVDGLRSICLSGTSGPARPGG